jgi:hypothetical protein
MTAFSALPTGDAFVSAMFGSVETGVAEFKDGVRGLPENPKMP